MEKTGLMRKAGWIDRDSFVTGIGNGITDPLSKKIKGGCDKGTADGRRARWTVPS